MSRLEFGYIRSLRSLCTVYNFEFNSLAFLERLEAFHIQT